MEWWEKRLNLILPVSVARLLGVFGELYSKLTGKAIILTRFTIYNLVRNNNFSSEKAIGELDYSFRPFSETIRDEVLWLRDEGMIL